MPLGMGLVWVYCEPARLNLGASSTAHKAGFGSPERWPATGNEEAGL